MSTNGHWPHVGVSPEMDTVCLHYVSAALRQGLYKELLRTQEECKNLTWLKTWCYDVLSLIDSKDYFHNFRLGIFLNRNNYGFIYHKIRTCYTFMVSVFTAKTGISPANDLRAWLTPAVAIYIYTCL